MKPFQSPNEAIKACNKNCQESWQRFANANKIHEETDPQAFHIAKTMFWAGYQYGSQFVSGYITSLTNPKPKSQN